MEKGIPMKRRLERVEEVLIQVIHYSFYPSDSSFLE
jgi:hypothetical protein